MSEDQPLRFELAAQEVIDLLVGNNIYDDPPGVVVRELLQNAVDACRLRRAVAPGYTPQVRISYTPPQGGTTGRLVVEDTGIGMTAEVVRQYFLRIGRSYYSSDDFRRTFPGLAFTPIARFGVGALSCFLIADVLALETRHLSGAPPVRLEIEGPHSRIRSGTAPPGPPGTRLELQLRPGVHYADLAAVVRRWARHLEFPVRVESGAGTSVIPADDGSGYQRTLLEPGNYLLKDPSRRHQLRTRRVTFHDDGIEGFVEYLYVHAPGALRRPTAADARGLIEVYADQAPRAVSLDGIYVHDQLPGFLGAPGEPVAFDINLRTRGTAVQLQLNRKAFVQDMPYRSLVARLDAALAADVVDLVRGAGLGPVQLAESLAALVNVRHILHHTAETGSTAVLDALAALPAYPLRVGAERRYVAWDEFCRHRQVVLAPVGTERVAWPESAAHLADDFWWSRHFHISRQPSRLPRLTSLDSHPLLAALLERDYALVAVQVDPIAGLSAGVYDLGAVPGPRWAGLPCLPFVSPAGEPDPAWALTYCGGWVLNRHHPVVAACLALGPEDAAGEVPGGVPDGAAEPAARWAAEKPWRDLVRLLGLLPDGSGAAQAAAAVAAAAGALGMTVDPAAPALPRHDMAPFWEEEWQRWLLSGGA